MKRISYWILSTVSVVVLLFGFDASQRGANVGATPVLLSGGKAGTTPSSTSGSGTGPGSGNASTRRGTTSRTPKRGGSTTTRTVTGSVIQTQWGPVQVQLTVAHRSITRVSLLQYPNGNSQDIALDNYALPVLIQETLKSQSANIDMVSGATFTSTGYIQSLQSALDRANL